MNVLIGDLSIEVINFRSEAMLVTLLIDGEELTEPTKIEMELTKHQPRMNGVYNCHVNNRCDLCGTSLGKKRGCTFVNRYIDEIIDRIKDDKKIRLRYLTSGG